jgi:hypothetical protein
MIFNHRNKNKRGFAKLLQIDSPSLDGRGLLDFCKNLRR